MSNGFPNRPARIDFGPEMQNKRAPTNSETDLNADQMNLTFWQTAGAGRVLPMAVILFDGVAPAITFQALAFDPRGELSLLAFVKDATGDYTFTFATTYKDESGKDVSFVPRFAICMTQGGAIGDKATAVVPSGQSVQVTYRDSSDILTDGVFMLAVW